MSDEHVIPAAIAGPLVIRVCKSCNDRMGSNVDSTLLKHSGLRAIAWTRGGGRMNKQEFHAANGHLADGRTLMGHHYLDEQNRFRFRPKRNQPDGSVWVHEAAFRNRVWPTNINVLREEDIKTISFSPYRPSQLGGLERPFIKILMGCMYRMWGSRVLQNPDFNPLRESLLGPLHPNVTFVWPERGFERAPTKIVVGEHLVWCASYDYRVLHGGVSLFGKVVGVMEVRGFRIPLDPKHMVFQQRTEAL